MDRYYWYRDYIIWPTNAGERWYCDITNSARGEIAATAGYPTVGEAMSAAMLLIDGIYAKEGDHA